MRKIILFSLLSLLVAIAGCKFFDPQQYLADQHSSLLMQGNSRDYADGYVDGCATGKKAAGDGRFHFSKNATRYSDDREYADGWEQGYMFCKEQRLNMIEQEAKEAKKHYYQEKARSHRERMWDEMKK